MTKRQREALKMALESMSLECKDLLLMSYSNAPSAKRARNEYKEIVAAMQVIEEMLRGVQTEMKI